MRAIVPALNTPPTLHEAILSEAERQQVMQFNPNAALQKRIFADGFVLNSPEFEVEFGNARYIGQRAEDLKTGVVRVFYCAHNDWNNVFYVTR